MFRAARLGRGCGGLALRVWAWSERATYCQDCLGQEASVMTGCIFNGLTAGDAVAECGG